jgi:hypothetical protein
MVCEDRSIFATTPAEADVVAEPNTKSATKNENNTPNFETIA